MKKASAVVFAVGCALLIAGFGIGWVRWWELAHRIAIVQALLGTLGVVVMLMVVSGIRSKGKARWTTLLLVAVLLLGFSALTFASTGLIVAPLGLLVLGFSIWKLLHSETACKTC